MKGNVLLPAEPIREAVKKWMKENDITAETLADRVGLSEKSVWRLLAGEGMNLTWVVADNLVTKTIGPLHWHTDPELSRIYWDANLNRLDLVEPLECEAAQAWARKKIVKAHDENPTKASAARSLGMDCGTYSKRLDKALIAEGREPSTKSVPQRGRSEEWKREKQRRDWRNAGKREKRANRRANA